MTTTADLVSVVIPCHNYGRHVGEAIESALAQTHQPIKIIVVDDGSADNSAAVAARNPVRLLSQANAGVCAVVRASRGEFVLRLDADDRLTPTYVDETLAALRRDPTVHFAYTEVAYFGAATGSYPVEDFAPDLLAERNYIHASALMKRDSFERVGGYDPGMATARCEEWDLWLAFAERGMRGLLVPRPLLLYRQHCGVSRNTMAWRWLQVWGRNLTLAACLQDHHPRRAPS